MKLTAYKVIDNPYGLRTAPLQRQWMDDTDRKFAYFCTPMSVANMAGWELINNHKFHCEWDGGNNPSAVQVWLDGANKGDNIPHQYNVPRGHFGYGVLTFEVGYLFQTDAGHNLWVRQSPNLHKDAICSLDGIVETDWLPYTFTVNWKFTRPNQIVTWEVGEPIAFIHPIPRQYLESVEPSISKIENNKELELEFRGWGKARNEFNSQRNIQGTPENKKMWRKDYPKGVTPMGTKGPEDHQRTLNLKSFKDK